MQLHHLTGAVTIIGQNIRQNEACSEIEVANRELVIKKKKKIQGLMVYCTIYEIM